MRKCNSGEISSFDLLLDTMCNTFGGIVFIALLVSILRGAVPHNIVETATEAGPSLSEVERLAEESGLIGECSQLEKTIEALSVVAEPNNFEGPMSAQALASLQATNDLLAVEQDQLSEKQLILAREISRHEELTKNSTVSAHNLQEQVHRLREDLRQQRADATQKVRLPRIHQASGMRPCFVFIANGRFYAVNDVSGVMSRGSRGYDHADVDVESAAGQYIVEIKKNSGQRIQPGCEKAGKIALALQNCNKNYEFIDFSVRPDSFAEFNYLKQLFVARGFSYNWSPEEAEIRIVVSSTVSHQIQ